MCRLILTINTETHASIIIDVGLIRDSHQSDRDSVQDMTMRSVRAMQFMINNSRKVRMIEFHNCQDRSIGLVDNRVLSAFIENEMNINIQICSNIYW